MTGPLSPGGSRVSHLSLWHCTAVFRKLILLLLIYLLIVVCIVLCLVDHIGQICCICPHVFYTVSIAYEQIKHIEIVLQGKLSLAYIKYIYLDTAHSCYLKLSMTKGLT